MVGFSQKKILAQAFVDCIENGLKPSSDVELFEDAVEMTFHCFLTDEEVFSYFFIAEAVGEVTQDLLLSDG